MVSKPGAASRERKQPAGMIVSPLQSKSLILSHQSSVLVELVSLFFFFFLQKPPRRGGEGWAHCIPRRGDGFQELITEFNYSPSIRLALQPGGLASVNSSWGPLEVQAEVIGGLFFSFPSHSPENMASTQASTQRLTWL